MNWFFLQCMKQEEASRWDSFAPLSHVTAERTAASPSMTLSTVTQRPIVNDPSGIPTTICIDVPPSGIAHSWPLWNWKFPISKRGIYESISEYSRVTITRSAKMAYDDH